MLKTRICKICTEDNNWQPQDALVIGLYLKMDPQLPEKSAIELIAWGEERKYFATILPFTSSGEDIVKAAAYKALVDLAGPVDQDKLIDLLDKTDDQILVPMFSFNCKFCKSDQWSGKRSSALLKALSVIKQKSKIIPILANTGGREALSAVLKEFQKRWFRNARYMF